MLNCGNKKFIGMVNVKEIESLDRYIVLMPLILINQQTIRHIEISTIKNPKLKFINAITADAIYYQEFPC